MATKLLKLPSSLRVLSQQTRFHNTPRLQCLIHYSTKALPEKLEYPSSPTSNHHDLQTFLDYTTRSNLDPESTVYLGTHYEYTTQIALQSLGMHLQRIGGASDYGIDLIGTWSLPSSSTPLKVIVQCKALALSSIRPATVRELEGAFVGAPRGWRDGNVLGLLVSQKTATKGVREALGRSRWPMAYVLCAQNGRVLQMLWNRRAEDVGLEGMGVATKYVGEDGKSKEVVLTWKGEAFEG